MMPDRPKWWPECPYPEDIFPMERSEYPKIVPNETERTALSGMLGRMFWEIAAGTIWDRLLQARQAGYVTFKEADDASGH